MKFFPKVLVSLAITSIITISLYAASEFQLDPTEKLVRLIKRDTGKQAIEAVIKEGANPLDEVPISKSMGNVCALQLAALLRAFTSLQALLDLGYDIDSKVQGGGFAQDYSALTLVIRDDTLTEQEKEQAASWLLGHGANANYKHFRGAPLIDAAALNLPGLVKLLLEHGANPNLVVDFRPGFSITGSKSKISQGEKSFRDSLKEVSPEVRKVWEDYQAQQKHHKKK